MCTSWEETGMRLNPHEFPLGWVSDREKEVICVVLAEIVLSGAKKTNMRVKSSLGKSLKEMADSLSEKKIKEKEINLDTPKRLLFKGGH